MKADLPRRAFKAQQDEITEHHIYKSLAKQSGPNKKILDKIAADELVHYTFWRKISGRDASPNWIRVWWYTFIAQWLGVTFALKLMESGEQSAQSVYGNLKRIKGVPAIIRDEASHEAKLIALLKDERLEYTGSIVLGLNDALVELTGALAGMTLALQNSKIVAIAGLITGLAASLSMAASNYLSTKEDHTINLNSRSKSPLRSAAYTGVTYLLVVIILIAPYFIFSSIYMSLAVTLCLAVLIIASYTHYISVAKDRKFWPQFIEMVVVSLSTAAISFLFGLALHYWLGI